MVNRYYQRGVERSQKVQALFASIASRYDLMNDVQSLGWHRRWKRLLVQSLALPPGGRVLDLCCGTGDVTLALARNGRWTVGLDFNLPMLRQAVKRKSAPAVSPPSWIAGDSLRLPFASASFDGVTIAYGLRNLADFGAALREFRRVVRPGGRLAILDFGKPSHPWWRGAYFGYLRWVVPVFGTVFGGDAAAYAYILESLRHYPDQAGITGLLLEAGWCDVCAQNLLGGAMALHAAANPAPVTGLDHNPRPTAG